jgi:hypothetical protein
LGLASQQRGIITSQPEHNAGPFQYSTKKLQEQLEGYPGHDIDISYPEFVSDRMPRIAHELSQFFVGRATTALISSRVKPWDQSPESFSKHELSFRMNGRWDTCRIMNGRWDTCRIAYMNERIASFIYDIGQYGAGAAHPNQRFETYTFSFVDRLTLCELFDFFQDPDEAIQIISAACVRELEKEYFSRNQRAPDEHQIIIKGKPPAMPGD